jgi:hypothetical protein
MAIGAPSRQKGTKMSVLDELVKKENWTVDRTLITGVPLLTYLEDISFGEIEEAADELASLREERDALRLVADAARTGQGLDDALDALDALKGEK